MRQNRGSLYRYILILFATVLRILNDSNSSPPFSLFIRENRIRRKIRRLYMYVLKWRNWFLLRITLTHLKVAYYILRTYMNKYALVLAAPITMCIYRVNTFSHCQRVFRIFSPLSCIRRILKTSPRSSIYHIYAWRNNLSFLIAVSR